MDKKLSFLNLGLLFIVAILLGWIIRIWIHPGFPSSIDGDSLKGPEKSLEAFSANRKTYPSSFVSSIMAKNLFRKERVEYKIDAPIQQKVSHSIPPPEVSVKGIMMLANNQIAVLDGNYFVPMGSSQIEKKVIKKKGYELKEYIGDYQISNIDKNSVTFTGKNGSTLTKYLKHESKTPIQREANALYFKRKKEEVKAVEQPKVVTNNTSPVPSAPPPSQQVAQPLAEAIPPRLHVSGSPQPQSQNSVANISGSRTSPPNLRTHISGHISGR